MSQEEKADHQTRRIQPESVPVLDGVPYDVFFKQFMNASQPCLFTGIINEWKSIKEWVDSSDRPDYEYLVQNFGDAIVPVANCKKEQYGSQPKEDMLFKDFIKYWQEYINKDYSKMERCLYLKDWHFSKQFPSYEAYKTPIYFTSDWLNEFWDSRKDSQSKDDYRFVYMGPKTSWTPLHADVFRSFSWSANVCGRKRWLLYPPGQEKYLKDKHGNLPFDVTSSEMNNSEMYPGYSQLERYFEVVQNAGEVIFVPSGWHHQVFNLEDTISINHNWFNGCNVDIVWEFLKTELSEVQLSISDCRAMDEWDEQCQLIMKANTGMDYSEFLQYLTTIAEPRIQMLLNIIAQIETQSHRDTGVSKRIPNKEPLLPVKQQLDVAKGYNFKEGKVFHKILTYDRHCDPENQEHISSVDYSNSVDRLLSVEGDNIEQLQMNKGHSSNIKDKRPEDEVDWETSSEIYLRRCLLSGDRRHLVFDLQRLKDVIAKLLMDIDFKFVKAERLIINPVQILDKLKTILSKVENLGLNTDV